MPTKIYLERQTSPSTWSRAKLTVKCSARGNFYVKHDDKVYVFKDQRLGTPVLAQEKDDSGFIRWVQVGRMAFGGIFLGEGLSHAEYMRTPEGIVAAEELLASFRRRAA